jgi:hypothetical protein
VGVRWRAFLALGIVRQPQNTVVLLYHAAILESGYGLSQFGAVAMHPVSHMHQGVKLSRLVVLLISGVYLASQGQQRHPDTTLRPRQFANLGIVRYLSVELDPRFHATSQPLQTVAFAPLLLRVLDND